MVQGSRSISGRYKIDKVMLRIVQEMEKPKNLCTQPMDMNYGGGDCWLEEGYQAEGGKGKKKLGQL